MKDGTDAIADWPILNALINAANGASWVSLPSRRRRRHRLLAARRAWSSSPTERRRRCSALERVLTRDPGMGVIRHADAGYPEAVETAKRTGVKVPGLTS